jgi:hypothetical protein
MNLLPRLEGRAARWGRRVTAGWAIVLLVLLCGLPARASGRPPFAARAGLDLASDAARGWASDAYLIYVENDEDLDASANAERWGYLFFSPSLEKARVYSVRDGKIVVAEFLDMKFEAPPVAADWIDSGVALAAAEHKVGGEFRARHQGALHTMLLMRGALEQGDPDATSWMVVYTAPGAPSLFVLVDASSGAVRRTWRG